MPSIRLLEILRQRGLREGFQFYRTLFAEKWYEAKFGIHTAGHVSLESIGTSNPLCHDYMPAAYRSLHAVMSHVQVRPEDVFVDFGAGMGRVVVVAATYPFARVIGIELMEEFVQKARDNVRRALPKLRCKNVEVLTTDATTYVIPPEATFLHFYNPFRGQVLSDVMDQIERSLLEHPRPLTVLFANPDYFEKLVKERNWRCSRQDVQWPGFVRVDPDSNRYRIYRLDEGGIA